MLAQREFAYSPINNILSQLPPPVMQYMLQKLELAQINCRLTDGGLALIGVRALELDPEVRSLHSRDSETHTRMPLHPHRRGRTCPPTPTHTCTHTRAHTHE